MAALLLWIGIVLPAAVAGDDPQGLGQIQQEATRSSFDPGMGGALNAQQPRITLELKGVDVLDVLKLISQRSEMNIVAGKNVRGLVTLYLKNVQIRDAMDTIVNTLDLAYVEENGIINVMTGKEFEDLYGRPFGKEFVTRAIKIRHTSAASVNLVVEKHKSPKGKTVFDDRTSTLIVTDREQNIQSIEKAIAELDFPLITKVFSIEFAKVEDIEAQLKDYLTPQTGFMKMDKRTNQLTVTDRTEKVRQISRILKSLDIRPKQVLIQAQVIAVDLFDAFRYGIDWDYVRSQAGKFQSIELEPAFDVSAPAAAAGSGTLSTFTFSGFHGLNTVISMLQNVGKTNTLSSPRITVINNEEAKLVDATRQPYVSQTVVQGQTTSQTADNIQFVDVGVTMTVVPTIADRERIVLKLKPEVSTQTGTLDLQSVSEGSETAFTRSSIPIVSSQTLETTVMVKSGQTLVVGGLIKDNESKLRRKLPFFSDLPWVGAAFRSKEVQFHKTELVIFLTPYIVNGETNSKEYGKYFDAQGELVNFDLVGGYDYGKAQRHSQGPLRLDHEPYWEKNSIGFPHYFPSFDLYQRSVPYQDGVNQYVAEAPSADPTLQQDARKSYQEQVAHKTAERLTEVRRLLSSDTEVELALRVSRDGAIQDVSWLNAGTIADEDVRRNALQAVRSGGAFPAFPAGLESAEELVDVKVKLTPASSDSKKS